jgi:hypothetical protein
VIHHVFSNNVIQLVKGAASCEVGSLLVKTPNALLQALRESGDPNDAGEIPHRIIGRTGVKRAASARGAPMKKIVT